MTARGTLGLFLSRRGFWSILCNQLFRLDLILLCKGLDLTNREFQQRSYRKGFKVEDARDEEHPIFRCLQFKSGTHGLAGNLRGPFKRSSNGCQTSNISPSCDLRATALSTNAFTTPTLEDSIVTDVNLLPTNKITLGAYS